MAGSELQLLCLCAAFWVAVAGYRGCAPLRFVAGLVLGALCAHLGWALLRPELIAARPWLLLDPRAGYCVLFVPLGALLLAPWREGVRAAAAFLSGAFAALPLPLAVARLGCVLLGCCGGVGMDRSWLSRHPVALYDIAGLAGLHLVLSRTPRPFAASVFCAGFGGLRLLLEPLRGGPSTGAPLPAVTLLASAWIVFGLLLSLRPRRFAFAAASGHRGKADERSPTLRLPHMGDP